MNKARFVEPVTCAVVKVPVTPAKTVVPVPCATVPVTPAPVHCTFTSS